MISVTEAHRRFGDLARIRNGHTIWIEVQTAQGVWSPIFDPSGIELIGYVLTPGANNGQKFQ